MNGYVGDGLPPSTVAAQIVHHRADVARREPENQALFGKLLQEYLKDPAIEETNVDTNSQLIQVVAEAGLEVLVKDPFSPDALVRQAIDSLHVIRLAVERNPEVLLFDGKDISNQTLKPPLFLWLLPRMLKLLGSYRLESLQDDLCEVLSVCSYSPCKSTDTWRYGPLIVRVLEGLIEGNVFANSWCNGRKG
ncbi:hypothetical protein EJ06DRAFT_480304 [Trichodelitschia bisporula]|uniref:Uncharacterized protein n=1 Tax=Trichodelitschia bisporula TaxID=703511 RepID=A0A6G1HQS0_9PEZI|nr:hypothetical protein EJ06DRAFT_480304 [Trichodelitschia bisporula]